MADEPRLSAGFHNHETGSGTGFRRADGDASPPPALFAGFDRPFEPEGHLTGTTRYVAGRVEHGRAA